MSNELVLECLRHKDNRNLQVRLDYLFLFRNETKAKIIRIMETWTNQKRAEWYKTTLDSKEQGQEPPEEALWVTMSYEQFSMFGFETIKHDTIKEAVDDLVESEYLGRRPHPEFPYGPPQYLLNTPMLQHRLNIQVIPVLDATGIIIPPRKKHTPQEKYPQGRGINTPRVGGNLPPARGENTPPSNNTTKNDSNNHTKNEGMYGAFSDEKDAPTPSSEELHEKVDGAIIGVETVKRITDKHKAMQLSDSQMDIGNAEDEEEDTAKMPAVRLQAVAAGQAPSASLPIDAPVRQSTVLEQAPGTPPRPLAVSAPPPTDRHGDAGGVQAHPLSAPTPAQAESPPAGSTPVHGVPTAQASGFTPPKHIRGKKPPEPLTLMGSKVMEWVGEIRGAKPRMTSGNVKACNALAECDGISLEALQAYFAHMEAQHKEVDLLTAAGETGNDKVGFLSFESNWPQLKRKLNGKPAQAPPDLSKAVLVDKQWNIYKVPGYDTEYTIWDGRLMTVEEADPLGYNGGAGLYNVTQYKRGV